MSRGDAVGHQKNRCTVELAALLGTFRRLESIGFNLSKNSASGAISHSVTPSIITPIAIAASPITKALPVEQRR